MKTRLQRGKHVSLAVGYTLLEAALAIAISLVLLLAMYSTTAMHYQTVETGREIAEQTQLARAVLERLRGDLRSTFTAWEPFVTQPAAGSSGSAAVTSSGSSNQSAGVQSDYNPPPGGVMGADSTLTLAVYASTEDLDFSSAGGQSDSGKSIGDVRMVRYWIATDRNPAPNGKAGLVRERVHRIPDPTMASGAIFSTTDVVAEEVQAIAFRYYDGTEWLNVWDTTETSPPLAIEAQVQMLLPTTAEGVNAGNWIGNVESKVDRNNPTARSQDKTAVTFKIVVAMPPAKASSASTGAGMSSNTGGSGGTPGSASAGGS